MPNGDFQPGSWSRLPSNCTRSFTITYVRCAEWGLLAIKECVTWAIQAAITCISWAWESVTSCLSWAWQTVNECVSWGSNTSTECCDWWPCSWLCDIVIVVVTFFCILFAAVTTAVCVLWGVIVTLACVAFAIVVSLVCIAFGIIEIVVCLLWVPVSIIFCLSTASGGTAFLLTDGTVMMQECKTIAGGTFATNRWWRLSPDSSGSYAGGSWSQLANSALGRRYFASSVLADGRVIVCGGEYTDATGIPTNDDNNTGEIYDPVANSWSSVSPPITSRGTDWANVGDGSSTVLPDGTFLLGSIDDDKIDKLNPATLKWTPMQSRPQVPSSDEDSWVLMPDSTVVGPSCSGDGTTWVYDIGADQWVEGNSLQQNLIDAASEIGPGLLLYDGTAFFLGSNQHTAIYTPGGKPAWVNGPDLPQESGKNLGIVDGPAALLVTGNVLFGAGPIDAKGDFLKPDYFFEFDGAAFNRTADPPNHDCMTYQSRLLLLPDATVFFCREDDDSFYAYTPASNTPDDRLRPVIQACPALVAVGSTIQVSGTQFNGLSQAVAYGDDCQTPTNYPLVRIINAETGHVRYCRTFDHTKVAVDGSTVPSMGVATGPTVITTNVAVPANLERGESHLEVVANAIASAPFPVTITITAAASS
jgi:Kelch motif